MPPELRQSLGEAKCFDQLTARCIERDIRDVGKPRWKFLDAPDVNVAPETYAWLKDVTADIDTFLGSCRASHPFTSAHGGLVAHLSVAFANHLNPHGLGVQHCKHVPGATDGPLRKGIWVEEHGHIFQLRDRVDMPCEEKDPITGDPLIRDTPASALTNAFKYFANRPYLGMPYPTPEKERRVFAPEILATKADANSPPPVFAARGTGPLRAWYMLGRTPAVEADGFRWLSYAQVGAAAVKLGKALRALPGVSVGDVCVLAGYNTIDWALFDFACCISGLRAVGCHATNDVPTALHVLSTSGARVLVATSDLFKRQVTADGKEDVWAVTSIVANASKVPDLKHVVVMDAHIHNTASGAADFAHAEPVIADLAAVAASAGTSIVPRKAAELSEAAAGVVAPGLQLWSARDFLEYDGVINVELPDPLSVPVGGRESMFTLLFTSGSSGMPKAVVITAAAFFGDAGGERLWAEPLVTPCFIPLSHSSDRFKVWKWGFNGGRVGFTFYDASHWRSHETEKKDDMVRSAVTAEPSSAGEPSINLERHYAIGTLFEQIRELRPTALAAPPILWTGLFSAFHEEVIKEVSQAATRLVGRSFSTSAELAAAVLAPEYKEKLPALLAAARKTARLRIAALMGDRVASTITGGGPTPRLIQRFAAALGGKARFADSYGTTECGSITRDGVPSRVGAPRSIVDVKLAPVAGVTGGASVSTDDPAAYMAAVNAWDDGSVGKVGEVIVKGPLVSPGYYKNPGKTAEAFIEVPGTFGPERWYRTGDVGERYTSCRIHLLGRAAAAKRNHHGRVIFPGGVEAVLETSSLVHHVVIHVSEPSNVVVALVVPKYWDTKETELQADFSQTLLSEGLDPVHDAPAAIALLPWTITWSTANGLMNGECKKNRSRILELYAGEIAAAAASVKT